MSAPLTFSEALEQYLDARDMIAVLAFQNGRQADALRANAVAARDEAAARMDELAPNPERA